MDRNKPPKDINLLGKVIYCYSIMVRRGSRKKKRTRKGRGGAPVWAGDSGGLGGSCEKLKEKLTKFTELRSSLKEKCNNLAGENCPELCENFKGMVSSNTPVSNLQAPTILPPFQPTPELSIPTPPQTPRLAPSMPAQLSSCSAQTWKKCDPMACHKDSKADVAKRQGLGYNPKHFKRFRRCGPPQKGGRRKTKRKRAKRRRTKHRRTKHRRAKHRRTKRKRTRKRH